jgi:membrane fusion protein, multidrug efflux system
MSLLYKMGESNGINYGEANAEKIRADRKKSDDNMNGSVQFKSVTASYISNDSILSTIKGYGRVVSTSTISVSAEVQGKITSAITLKKGIHFKQGQTLFTLNSSDATLALKARKSGFLALLTSILPDMKVDFPERFNTWNNFYKELKVNEPISHFPNFTSLKEKNFIISRKILTEYYQIKSDEEQLKKYSISAPFDGSIIDAFTDVGAIVNPGLAVLSIIRDNTMEIEIPIAAEKINQLAIGSAVTLVDNNYKSFEGKVIRIGDYINQQTQTVPVFVNIISQTDGLYNGMYLDANITGNGYENVVEIPRKALIRKNEVYIVEKDSALSALKVKVIDYKENTVTVSGIPNNSNVVIESVVNINEGDKVVIRK